MYQITVGNGWVYWLFVNAVLSVGCWIVFFVGLFVKRIGIYRPEAAIWLIGVVPAIN